MARDFERRPDAEALARPREQNPEGEESDHRISNGVAAVLVVWSIVLEVADYFGAGEFFITDALCVLTIDVYLLYKGFSPLRMFGGQAIEAIPIVGGVLPGYLAGVVFTILQDRSKAVAAVAEHIPKKNTGGRVAGAAARQATSRVAQASQKVITTAEKTAKKAQDLRARIPGPLRSTPGQDGSATLPKGRQSALARIRGAASAMGTDIPAPAPSSTAPGDLPFPETYYRYERELLPELEDITSDIDVTGERTAKAAEAARRARQAPKQVQ